MIQRIFIAIELPEGLKEELVGIQSEYDLPVSWVPRDNLHLTVLFLGAVRSESLFHLTRVVERIAQEHSPFVVSLDQISYGPDMTLPPRLIWVKGPSNESFQKLKKDIDCKLREDNLYYVSGQPAETKIHVTLGRVRKWEWSKLDSEARQPIDRPVSFEVPVDRILIMESKLTPGRPPKYSVLETVDLGS